MVVEQQLDQKCKLDSSASIDTDNLNSSFDCNICLDFANEPVVTLCGHLYCWPCIYKWFLVQSTSLPSDEYPQCPICKTEISYTTVVPLYGRGRSMTNPELEVKNLSQGAGIPPRPPPLGTRAQLNAASQTSHQLLPYRNPYQLPYVYTPPGDQAVSSSSFNQTRDVFGVIGLYGEMVYARMFGNSPELYAYPNSYNNEIQSSRSRLRSQEMQLSKSLNRVSLFLFCCLCLCLILF